jgi:hypothetical protein
MKELQKIRQALSFALMELEELEKKNQSKKPVQKTKQNERISKYQIQFNSKS